MAYLFLRHDVMYVSVGQL